MNNIIEQNIESLKAIAKAHHVDKMYAFGSVCTDEFNENSDIDLIVKFNHRFFDGYVDNFLLLERKLQDLFDRRIDLTVQESLQNPYFIKLVNQTKTLVYERHHKEMAV